MSQDVGLFKVVSENWKNCEQTHSEDTKNGEKEVINLKLLKTHIELDRATIRRRTAQKDIHTDFSQL